MATTKSFSARTITKLEINGATIPIKNATINGTIDRPDATDSDSEGWKQKTRGHREMKIDFDGDVKKDAVDQLPDFFLDETDLDLTVKAYISDTAYWTGPVLLESLNFSTPVGSGENVSFRVSLTSNGAMTFNG